MSKSLRSLRGNEHREQIAQVAHQKFTNRSFFQANHSYAHFWAKNERFARKTDEQIPSPGKTKIARSKIAKSNIVIPKIAKSKIARSKIAKSNIVISKIAKSKIAKSKIARSKIAKIKDNKIQYCKT